MILRYSLAMVMTLALVACGDTEEVTTTEQGADAQGDILGGSISDEMVPLQEVRSVSPPAKPAPGESGAASGGSGGASDGAAGNEAAEERADSDSASETESAEEPAEEG